MDVYKIFKKYKLKISDSKIFDPVRNKFVALTPEERIRQQTIRFLFDYMEIPPEQLRVEVSLNTLGDKGNRKRIDICIFNDSGDLCAIIECKANYIGFGEAPYQQALDYVTSLGIKYYFVVDGIDMFGFRYDKTNDQFIQLTDIPKYSELI